MLPNVYGFQWSAGHLIFLGAFFVVGTIIAITLAMALVRSLRDKGHKVETIRWKSEFGDLPERDRACRHQFDGRLPGRVCGNGFDCRLCAKHAEIAPGTAAAEPKERYHHRGHTWAQPQPDGTVLVGLDDLATSLTGTPERLDLPAPGTRVQVNGTAWRMERNGASARVLSPVDGKVVETGDSGRGWYLKIRPDNVDFRHLLRGREARAWLQREMDRMGALLPAPAVVGPTMADGGELVEDAAKAMPEADWDAVWGGLFLQP
ncbi:MAG TPA: hypothetical protein VN442_03350 [Bryobacteraceae bacterium]|nr:hypothetical protein [Bryobacteraceae bacterium]